MIELTDQDGGRAIRAAASGLYLGHAVRTAIIGSRGQGWYWDIQLADGQQFTARRKPDARRELHRLAAELLTFWARKERQQHGHVDAMGNFATCAQVDEALAFARQILKASAATLTAEPGPAGEATRYTIAGPLTVADAEQLLAFARDAMNTVGGEAR